MAVPHKVNEDEANLPASQSQLYQLPNLNFEQEDIDCLTMLNESMCKPFGLRTLSMKDKSWFNTLGFVPLVELLMEIMHPLLARKVFD
ncbi:unnamed protein product [Sphenostylis stenocarpa]|uniref:Uncharacterized protein n=1 Tax=Sphenostylis stenocarpa TaxID=92480 RepID=A0AA86SU20_9FABA|nr:unnamed protein product [Sphenostylis stenocarpa]